MKEHINQAALKLLESEESAPLNRLIRRIAEEVFRLTEWLTLAAAIGVVGAKFDNAAATAIGKFLIGVIAAYLGAKLAHWADTFFGRSHPILAVVILGVPFALGSAWLIHTLVAGMIRVAAA